MLGIATGHAKYVFVWGTTWILPSRSAPSLRRLSTAPVRTLPRWKSDPGGGTREGTSVRGMWTSISSILLAGIMAAGTPISPVGATWVPPLATGLSGTVHGFERPTNRFASGHRGVDFAAPIGTPVRSIGDGTITHVGKVAGVASVTVDHQVVRSSYLPIDAAVAEGDYVTAGDVIGFVAGQHCPVACLHVGIRRPAWERLDALTDPYLDPIAWIRRIPVLKPLA